MIIRCGHTESGVYQSDIRSIKLRIAQRCFTVGAQGTISVVLSAVILATMALQQKSRSLMNLSRATGFATSPRHARNKVFTRLLSITYTLVRKYSSLEAIQKKKRLNSISDEYIRWWYSWFSIFNGWIQRVSARAIARHGRICCNLPEQLRWCRMVL